MNGKIRIVGSHDHGDGNPEIVKTECPAFCEKDGDLYVITYTDNMGNEELSSKDDGPTCSTHRVEIGEGKLSMIQTGHVNSELRFGVGNTWKTDYQTPYGLMKMTAITRHLMMEINAKKISAHLQYELQIDGSKISDSKVRISFIYD